MSDNVFGEPITETTLSAMPEYTGRTITRRDLAQVALHRKNAQKKDADARLYAESLKAMWGRGTATKCLIYNATGGTVTLVKHHDWSGHIGPFPYPAELANGQWCAFLHVRPTLLPWGSSGAVVYRGMNEAGLNCYWIMAWRNPWNRLSYDNQVVAYIQAERPELADSYLIHVNSIFGKPQLQDSYTYLGCKCSVASGSDKSPFVGALFTLENLE